MGRLRVTQVKSGYGLFGSEIRLLTAEGLVKMQHIPRDEGIFIHSKSCPVCHANLKEKMGDRLFSLPLIEKLGLQDSIKEIFVRVGKQDEQSIVFAADIKTASGKKYGAVPSCAIALALTQKEPCNIYVDEELLTLQKEFDQKQAKRIKMFVLKGFPGAS